jgi:hypothetical protein
MIEKVLSKNNIPIRLTDERWSHITEEHGELAGMKLDILDVVYNPSCILLGNKGEFFAVRELYEGKYIIVVYKEIEEKNDGFIITAFFSTKLNSLKRRKKLWPR